MNQKRFKTIASVFLLLIRKGSILLLRRYQTGFWDGNYSVPAGHLDAGESLTDALCREAREEVGLHLTPNDITLVHVMHRKEESRLDFFFTTDKEHLEPQNMERHKADALQWFPLTALPENIVPSVKKAIENYQKGLFYDEYGWNE